MFSSPPGGFIKTSKRFYEQQAERHGKNDRVALMLEQMARHERFFLEELKQYHDDEAKDLLDRWLQYGPDEEKIEVPAPDEIKPNMQVEDVVKMALQFDERLIDFYRTAAERIEEESLRVLFSNLIARLEKNQAERTHDASSLWFDM